MVGWCIVTWIMVGWVMVGGAKNERSARWWGAARPDLRSPKSILRQAQPSMLRHVLRFCAVGLPRAARAVHVGFPIRVRIRLIALRVRPIGIRATRHEHRCADKRR